MSENNLTERQRKIQQYLSKYRIEEVLGDLLNTLAHSLDPNPVVFMIKYLSNLCSKKELEENGIVINGPAPSPNLAIVFPNFTNPNKNLFKTYLTFENFLQAKNQKTPQNVSLRDLINIGLENEEHPIGIFAADKDTYSTFSNIFDPILKDMNKGMQTIGYTYAEKVDTKELLSQDYALSEKENKTLDQITVKIKRNLPEYTFNTLNSTSDRDAIVEKLGKALKDLNNEQFEDFHNWADLTEETVNKLKSSFGLEKFKKERPDNLRYKEWPSGRAALISANQRYAVLMNKEEHFELIVNKAKDIDFQKDLTSLYELISRIQQKVNFVFDPRYGYITANPKYLGLGLRIRVYLRIPQDRLHIFKMNITSLKMNYPFLAIKEVNRTECIWRLKNTKTMGLTELELIKSLKDTIHFLLAGIIEPDVASNTGETPGGSFIRGSMKNNFLDSMDDTMSEINLTNSGVARLLIENKLKSAGSPGECTFEDLTQPEILYPDLVRDSFGMLQSSYLIVRRNIDGFPFKLTMSEQDNTTLVGFLTQFSQALPSVFLGEVITVGNSNYEKTGQEIIQKYGLEVQKKSENEKKWPKGTAIFKAFNSKLVVIANLEDHLTMIYEFNSGAMANTLKEASSLVHILEKKATSFAFQKEFGYITVNPEHSGSAVEIAYTLKLHPEVAELSKTNLPEGLQSHLKENVATVRANRLHSMKIATLITFVSSLLREEKRFLYDESYQSKLKAIYPASFLEKVSTVCKSQPFEILDTFNSNLELQCPDTSMFKELSEPFLDYIQTRCPKKAAEITLKKVAEEVKFSDITGKFPDIINVKVEMSRNLEKYRFRLLMSTSDKTELNDIVQNAFQSLSIEGQLFEYKDIYNMAPTLRSIFNDSLTINQEDKVFIPINRRFACWINQLDHVRLVGQVAINETGELIKEFEAIFSQLEKEGNTLLYDSRFGYISEKVDLCGLNIQFEVQVITSNERKQIIEDLFKRTLNWKTHGNEASLKQNPVILVTSTQGLNSTLEALDGLQKFVRALVESEDEQKMSQSIADPAEIIIEEEKSAIMKKDESPKRIGERSSTAKKERPEDEVDVEASVDFRAKNLLDDKKLAEMVRTPSVQSDFVSPNKSDNVIDGQELENHFRRSIIIEESHEETRFPTIESMGEQPQEFQKPSPSHVQNLKFGNLGPSTSKGKFSLMGIESRSKSTVGSLYQKSKNEDEVFKLMTENEGGVQGRKTIDTKGRKYSHEDLSATLRTEEDVPNMLSPPPKGSIVKEDAQGGLYEKFKKASAEKTKESEGKNTLNDLDVAVIIENAAQADEGEKTQ